jgi:hypothetical protein
MPWTLYKSTDASAPTLSGTAGSLLTLLDAILVDGYGTKPAAGWTEAYTGTNKRVYRMGSGRLMGYVRILDDASGAAGAKEGFISVNESMSSVDTATDTIISASGNDLPIRKSDTADGTARPWVCVADGRTFILVICANSTSLASVGTLTYAGEIFSFVPNDNYNLAVMGRFTKNSATYNTTTEASVNANGQATFASDSGHYIARDSTGIYKQRAFSKAPLFASATGYINGPFAFPNPADGGAILGPLYVRDSEPSGGETLRGRLRGMWSSGHGNTQFGLSPGGEFSGTGDWAGKTFLAPMNCGETAGGHFVLETSDTVPSN